MAKRHETLAALPQVEMAPLRRLVKIVHILERLEAGEVTLPEAQPGSAWAEEWSGLPMSGIGIKIANLHNAIKRIAEHRLGDWDKDPLIIARWSEWTEMN